MATLTGGALIGDKLTDSLSNQPTFVSQNEVQNRDSSSDRVHVLVGISACTLQPILLWCSRRSKIYCCVLLRSVAVAEKQQVSLANQLAPPQSHPSSSTLLAGERSIHVTWDTT
jgi:hypothetical protein